VVRFSLAVIHYFGYYHPPWIPNEQSTTLPHLNRHNKEQKTMETKTWLEQTMADRPGYSFLHYQKLDKFVRTSSKWLATRYYQMKIGYAVIGTHLKRINSIDDDRCWWFDSGE
jgi:hypothetical protein